MERKSFKIKFITFLAAIALICVALAGYYAQTDRAYAADGDAVDILTTTVPEPPVTIGGTQGIGKTVGYSYELGMPAYEIAQPLGHNNLWWFVLNTPDIDASKIEGDKALSFWIYADKPLTGTVDTRIELSSTGLEHDYGQWWWSVNEIFGSSNFALGKWNHIVLKLENSRWTPNSEYTPDFTKINFFRIFTMLPDSSNTFFANIQIIPMPSGVSSGAVKADQKEPFKAEIDEVTLNSNMLEYQTLELPTVNAKDPLGSTIPVSYEVVGPNNFKRTGKSILLDGGGGTYTVKYQAMDALGFVTESVHVINVTEHGNDVTAPQVVFTDGYIKEIKSNTLHDFAEGVEFYDNRGADGITIEAQLIDTKGKKAFSYSGKASNFKLLGKTTSRGIYTVQIVATDKAGNSETYISEVSGYTDANENASVTLVDFNGNSSLDPRFEGYCRIVNARPENSEQELSLEFNYEGGADNIYDVDSYYQAVVFNNEVAPDISKLDVKYLAVRMNIYIDAVYPTDSTPTPSDGSGYGNMVLGFSSQRNYGGNARAEYNMRDLGLKVGWNDVIIKFGNIADSYNGVFDPANITTFYIATNWGSSRKFLFNDIRFVETDDFARETYVPFAIKVVSVTEAENTVLSFDENAEFAFREVGNVNSPVYLPNIVSTTYTGGVNETEEVKITVTDSLGNEYDVEESNAYTYSTYYFIPDSTGVYNVKYETSDIFGKVAVLERSVTVGEAYAVPEITVSEKVPTSILRGDKFNIPKVSAKDADGNSLKVSIYWVGANGKIVDVTNSGSIKPTLSGRSYLKYVTTDSTGQKSVLEYRITVKVVYSSVYSPQRYAQAVFFLIVGICAGVVIVGAGLGIFFGIRHKKRKRAMAAAEQETDIQSDEIDNV